MTKRKFGKSKPSDSGTAACLDIEGWRAATRKEVGEWLKSDKKPNTRLGSMLVVRARLRPVDVYCYLKARFGEPNGFQNFLRRDDSDNWIHWDFSIKAGATDVYLAGTSREVHIMVGEPLSDQQWKGLIVGIRADFARVGVEKSKALRSLEKYVVFQNKFVSIAGLCADLHASILDAPIRKDFPKKIPTRRGLKEFEKAMQSVSSRANDLFGDCLKLKLLTPVMAEAFINMMILMFARDAVRNDAAAYQAFIRSKIPDRLALLSKNCDGFAREIDKSTDTYAHFMRVIDKRNFALHGNVDPIREQLEIVYFDGRRPLFNAPGNHIARFFEQLEAINEPETVVADYEATHSFLWEIMECLEPRSRAFCEQVINDAYPGFEVHKKRATRILPDAVVMGMHPGMRYDDDLDVDW